MATYRYIAWFTCWLPLMPLVGCASPEDQGPSYYEYDAELRIFPSYPVKDSSHQLIMVSTRFTPKCESGLKLVFGNMEIDPPQYQPRNNGFEIPVEVPSWWEGDKEVRLECGEEVKDSTRYHANPVGWLRSADNTDPLDDLPDFPDSLSSATGDLDGDGFVDLVTVRNEALVVIWSRVDEQGAVSFEEQPLPAPRDYPMDLLPSPVALADLDNDGRLDVAQVNNNSLAVYLQRARRDFEALAPVEWSSRAWNVAAGDLDSDGDVDLFLVVDDNIHEVLLNDGSGNFSWLPEAVQPAGCEQGAAAILVDVNRDGYLDAVVANGWLMDDQCGKDRNKLYINQGDGRFINRGGVFRQGVWNSWGVQMIEREPNPVLMFSHLEYPPSFHRILEIHSGDIYRLGSEVEFLGSCGLRSRGLAMIGDVDGNGQRDIVLYDPTMYQDLSWYREIGECSFELVLEQNTINPPLQISPHLADVDRDGFLDIVLPDTVLFFRNLAELYGP